MAFFGVEERGGEVAEVVVGGGGRRRLGGVVGGYVQVFDWWAELARGGGPDGNAREHDMEMSTSRLCFHIEANANNYFFIQTVIDPYASRADGYLKYRAHFENKRSDDALHNSITEFPLAFHIPNKRTHQQPVPSELQKHFPFPGSDQI